MASTFDMADILTLTKMAWDLYHSCNLVSGDAPDGFRQLVNELASLQGTLRALRDDVNSNSSFFEELAEDRKHTLERCLQGCLNTLQRLKELITKYRNLGVGDGKQIWQKIKWVTQRGQIEDLKSRIMVHKCKLSLCMSSIGNSSLKRLDILMSDALERDTFFEPADCPQPEAEILTFPTPVTSTEAAGLEIPNEGDTPRSIKPRPTSQRTSAPGIRPRGSTSSESVTSSYSEGSGSNFFTTNPFPNHRASISHNTAIPVTFIDRKPVPPTSCFESVLEEYQPSPREDSIYKDHGPVQEIEPGNSYVQDALESAMQQLHQLHLREQLLRPLRYEPRNGFHLPGSELTEKFEALANNEEQVRRLTTRDWLRVAVWWLLKARTSLANCDKPTLVSPRGSLSPSMTSWSTSHQAYVDLLKASYILYDIVLRKQLKQSLLTDENRKLIFDLSEGINEEFALFSSVDIPDSAATHAQNLDIWEPLQPDETSAGNSDSLFGLENVRYTTVELEDAGAEEERVLLRTFVNASIGIKKHRIRAKGAPYMLLLSTVEGESEPKITICNQSGTLCMQRDFLQDDLAQLIKISNACLTGNPGARISEPVRLMFDSLSVAISFQHSSDLGQFINIPKEYFDAVRQREPVDSEVFSESTLFRRSVEQYEKLRAPIMKSTNPPTVIRSCEVRILERTFGEAWRSVRRIVISSSLAERTPMCFEFFLPMSRVQVTRLDDSREVQLKWSDTGQEKSDKTDGNYNPLYSYVYDDNTPNIGLAIQFRSQDQAQEFEKVIQGLSHKPSHIWTQPSSSGRVYDVVDAALDQKRYKAIVLIHSRLSWRYGSLYYLYRDTDYIYDSSNLQVRFPRISYVDYISSHVEQLYRADNNVYFSHCEKKVGNMTVDFNDEKALHAFMSSLAPSYELCFSRHAESMNTKGKTLLGSNNSTKGDTEVQIWRKGKSVQLASRWNDHVTDRWLTTTIPPRSQPYLRDGNRVEFPPMPFSRGTVLNMAVITSGSPKDPKMARRNGPISINFRESKDRDEFMAAINTSSTYGHYDLLGS